MKRYRFSLEQVLRLRRVEAERAREALHIENQALRRRILGRDREAERYSALAARARATSPAELRAERLAHGLAADALALADHEVLLQATRATLAQLAYRTAHQRVEMLERLEERQRAAYRLEVQRADSVVLDDLVTAQFVRERAEAERRDAHV